MPISLTTSQLWKRLQPTCTDLPEEIVQDFLTRMDSEYFERFSDEQIVHHLLLASRLDLDQPCQLSLRPHEKKGYFDLVIVAFDYFSEFATICGLLSVFGMDIREGSLYTFSDLPSPLPPKSTTDSRRRTPQPHASYLQRKKIVDHFLLRPLMANSWTHTRQEEFAEELSVLFRLLDINRFQEVRRRVNRRLVEVLSRSHVQVPRLLNPVQVHFHNSKQAHDTVMSIRSRDTPAFLYAFSNALAMRGVYIRKAQLKPSGEDIHDEFHIQSRYGKKITEQNVLHELRTTAVLIKQFTQFLRGAPDPAKALEHFDQFLDLILKENKKGNSQKTLAFLTKKDSLALLAQLLGTSDFLWEDFLRKQHVNLLPLLKSYQRLPLVRSRSTLTKQLRFQMSRAKTPESKQRALNSFKDRELFRIDMKHLIDPSTTLSPFSQALTELAEIVLEESIRENSALLSHKHGRPLLENGAACPFAILGMGKLGGQELGYASDIEVLFVYQGPGSTSGRQKIDTSDYFEKLVRGILEWVEAKQEGIFHIDIRLRPHGSKGQLANTLPELEQYYGPSGMSAPFERQALIKLRRVAGNHALGQTIELLRDTLVYTPAPWDLANALDLRKTQIRELVSPGDINLKYSPGGLIDIEYATQYFQLLHGHQHRQLQTPNTLAALKGLAKTNIISARDLRQLSQAYITLRLLIDGLRIVRGNAKDLVLPPSDSEAFVFLARRVGYINDQWQVGAQRLKNELRTQMTHVHQFFTTHFGKR